MVVQYGEILTKYILKDEAEVERTNCSGVDLVILDEYRLSVYRGRSNLVMVKVRKFQEARILPSRED